MPLPLPSVGVPVPTDPEGHDGLCSSKGDAFAPGWDPDKGLRLRWWRRTMPDHTDEQRIEWMERNPGRVVWAGHAWHVHETLAFYPTLRAAIDDAMDDRSGDDPTE